MRRVVVTGIGTINSTGHNVKDSFKAVVDGVCGIDTITLFDASEFSVKIAGEVKDFDPTTVMDKKEVKKADRFIQLGIKAALEAMIDSGYVTQEDKKVDASIADRFGMISGSGIGGLSTIERNSIVCETKGSRKVSPFFIPSSLANMLSGFISIEHNLRGPSLSHVTACAASTHALNDAVKTIMIGGADRILVVGAESAICAAGVAGFAAMKALSTRNDEPKKSSRPFDIDRDGFVMGEGAGALVVEDLEIALARGAKIYAEIIGFGESGDANHITSPVMDGPLRAMKAAFEMVKSITGEYPKIDYINAHGTSTPVGDKNETAAIKALFEGKDIPLVSSTKGQIGHCLGAAGAIEAIFTLKALEEGIIPPTINIDNQDPECDLDYIANVARKANLTTVMSNNFGFGGTNGSVIFRRYEK
ncbi:MAG: beta-ketoacyl-ACP synthase II [Aliarcobacter sp.]|jgi:3-oxoacyl-[acyl-carrier-protein] synthase II|nr:beta-ketoacyl-ACP synthase II [Aliarcobacter sp.]